MANDADDIWNVFALRYGGRTDQKRVNSFLMEPRPDEPHPIDYFMWVLRNRNRTILVDMGFDQTSAARRGRNAFDDPPILLRRFGIDPQTLDTVIVTHMHFDHVGCLPSFPAARFHIQKDDIGYASGPAMAYDFLRAPYDTEHVAQMRGLIRAGRAVIHDGDGEMAPGITLHRIDGHATGLQCVRAKTARGHVVLASDAAPYFENFLDYRVHTAVTDVEAMLAGYDRLRSLATSIDHILPGHDPLVCELYPAEDATRFAYRLDVSPSRSFARG